MLLIAMNDCLSVPVMEMICIDMDTGMHGMVFSNLPATWLRLCALCDMAPFFLIYLTRTCTQGYDTWGQVQPRPKEKDGMWKKYLEQCLIAMYSDDEPCNGGLFVAIE